MLTSERGKKMLLVNNYKFSFTAELKGGEKKWRCKASRCTANVYTVGMDNLISRSNLNHNHLPLNERQIQRQTISNLAKCKAVEEISNRPSKILRTVMGTEKTENILSADLSYIKRNIYNARRKLYPKLPKCRSDVHAVLKSQDLQTSRKENFLLVNDEKSSILVFSCLTNLTNLCMCSKIYVDGTFNYCTKFFLQLFTIHGHLSGHYVPLVFCVLPDKTADSYSKAFEFVIKQCSEHLLSFRPSEIVVDFEKAIHTAAKNIWPQIKIIGCRFHLSQAWWRHIQKFGLSKDYKEGTEVGKWLGYCFGLMFLNPEEVADAFVFSLLSIRPTNDKLTLFADYLTDSYVSEDAIFPPELWAVQSASSAHTTNACESFHSHLKKNFNSAHPSIFIFCDFLQTFQTEIYVKLQSVDKQYVPSSRTKKRQEYLQKKINDFRSKKISVLEYIKLTSHYYSSVFLN